MYLDEKGIPRKPKIYIAGPECFQPNAKELAVAAEAICERYGFIGMSPMDEDKSIDFSIKDKRELARQIFEKDARYVRECDIIVANFNNFRGWEPDGGMAFECGYGYALGKAIYGFMADGRNCTEKFTEETYVDEHGTRRDMRGLTLEPGLTNLMLTAPSTVVEGDFETAIKRLRSDLNAELAAAGKPIFQVEA